MLGILTVTALAVAFLALGCGFLFGLTTWGFPKIGVSKMVGFFHGKSYYQIDDDGWW